MSKNLDGIKKISSEELAKSRKIVLDFIGEKDKRKENKKNENINGRKFLDGISFRTAKKVVDNFGKEDKKIVKEIKKEEKNDLKDDNVHVDEIKKILEKNIKKQEEEKKRQEEQEEEEKQEKENNQKLEKENEKQEEEKKRQEEQEKEKLEKENKTSEERKIRKEKKEIEKKEKKVKSKKKNEKKKKKSKILKEKRKKYLKKIKLIMKKIFFITALVVVSFLFFYFVFYFLLIKFNVDSRLTRKMSEFIPVPVAVSKKGFVEYYDFIDISNNVYKKNSNQDEVKKIIYEEIAKIIILKNIIKEYKLDGDFSDEKIKEKINSVLLSERNINLDDYLKNEISNFKILVFIK